VTVERGEVDRHAGGRGLSHRRLQQVSQPELVAVRVTFLNEVFVLYHATRLNASIDLDRSAIDV